MRSICFRITEEQEAQLREGVIGNVSENDAGEIVLEWLSAEEIPGTPIMRCHRLVGRIVATFLALAMLAASACADVFRVTFTANGLVERVTVQAATPYEARRVVQNMFGGYVTGVQKVAQMSLDKNYLREIAHMVHAKLPDNHGFILLTFPFGNDPGGRVTYTSNANREAAIAAMKEFLITAGAAEDWMKHLP